MDRLPSEQGAQHIPVAPAFCACEVTACQGSCSARCVNVVMVSPFPPHTAARTFTLSLQYWLSVVFDP